MRSVVIGVFDGLQPSQVTPDLMPNVHALAQRGVFFEKNHPVFPSVTRINAASLVTGRYPGAHGLAANTLVARDYHPTNAIEAMEPELSRLARKTDVLFTPTLADILFREGQEYVAVGVGTSGNAYVHNPTAERSGGATIHPEFTLPPGLHHEIASSYGAWPEAASPNTPRMAHAARLMTEYVLTQRNPRVALIWSSEPDKSQHAAGVGSDLSNRAIREADAEFGKVLRWLEDNDRIAETDVLVVSDHGYSTISERIDVVRLIRDAGFPEGDRPGGVTVALNGGCALFYTHGSDKDTADRLAALLMEQPWCGAIVASDAVSGIAGTLPASAIGGEGRRAAELAMSFRWNSERNTAGYAGTAPSTGGAPGLGQHGSLSKHEMNNTLIAAGPGFKSGVRSEVPSGNIDIAPTILHLLGISNPVPMDGRVLTEALKGGPSPESVVWNKTNHDAKRGSGSSAFAQRIVTSTVGGTTYVDQGNAL